MRERFGFTRSPLSVALSWKPGGTLPQNPPDLAPRANIATQGPGVVATDEAWRVGAMRAMSCAGFGVVDQEAPLARGAGADPPAVGRWFRPRHRESAGRPDAPAPSVPPAPTGKILGSGPTPRRATGGGALVSTPAAAGRLALPHCEETER